MKFNDIHKQFAVKSFAKMMTRAEIQGRSREEKEAKIKKVKFASHSLS